MFGIGDPDTAQYLVRKVGDTEILETEETVSMGVSLYRDGVSMTKRRKRQRLLMDSHFLDLPDLSAYAKVPNKRFITLTRFIYKKYPNKTIPFVIRNNLIMNTTGINASEDLNVDTFQLQR